MKPKRIVNRALLDEIRGLPCVACGKPPPSDPCHVRSRGAGGNDEPDNLLPMCRTDHSLSHGMGWFRFSQKYPSVYWALKVRGWEFDTSGQWPKMIRK